MDRRSDHNARGAACRALDGRQRHPPKTLRRAGDAITAITAKGGITVVTPEPIYRVAQGVTACAAHPAAARLDGVGRLRRGTCSTALFTGVVLATFALTIAWRYGDRNGTLPPPATLMRVVPELMREPAGLLGSGLAACLSFAMFALIPARLSAVGLVDRLRLRSAPRWKALGMLGAGGVVGIGQVFSGVMVFAGMEGRGALGVIARAFADAPAEIVGGRRADRRGRRGGGRGAALLRYMLTRLRERWGPRVAVLTSAALFGLVHFDPWHSAIAFTVGLLLGWLSLRAGTVRSTIAAHVLNNLVGVSRGWWSAIRASQRPRRSRRSSRSSACSSSWCAR